VIRELRPLASVNEAIADVEAGRVAARIVFQRIMDPRPSSAVSPDSGMATAR
jgi:hypothetical protein